MKSKLLLIAGMLLCSVLMTACTEEQNVPGAETLPQMTETYPVLDDPNAEFMDAPETAPVIIDPDPVPDTEPMTEIYNAAPETMPENQE